MQTLGKLTILSFNFLVCNGKLRTQDLEGTAFDSDVAKFNM